MAHHVNYHALTLPPGFELEQTPIIRHRYSKYLITHDPDRIGGWAVADACEYVEPDEDELFPARSDWRFRVVSYFDGLDHAVNFINALTNPHLTWHD